MGTSLNLIVKVISLQVPPTVLIYAAMNRLQLLMKTGNRRFEFERGYLERPDPWNYHSSLYEREKYERTLARAIEWRTASKSALEIGCSVGVFSRMLADHFDHVTAVDISTVALRLAADYNRAQTNIHFARRYAQSLNLGEPYDVIFCAELFYYISRSDMYRVCEQLQRHLAPAGIVVLATGLASAKHEDVLAETFERRFQETVEHPSRPYRISVFSRKR